MQRSHPILLLGRSMQRIARHCWPAAIKGGAHHPQPVPDLYLGVGCRAVRLDAVHGELRQSKNSC